MTARDKLAEIHQRVDAATPGPWEAYWPGQCCEGCCIEGAGDVFHNCDLSHHDALFIQESRTDIPKLVAALTAVLDLHQQSAVYPTRCHCESRWPCHEVRTITEALDAS